MLERATNLSAGGSLSVVYARARGSTLEPVSTLDHEGATLEPEGAVLECALVRVAEASRPRLRWSMEAHT